MSLGQKVILLVGAGLTSATVSSLLDKDKFKIICVDARPHLGGNCYDYKSNGTLISLYGPHIFHTSNDHVINLVKQHTEFNEYEHSVLADIGTHKVPFPYSKETESILGPLTEEQVIKTFFVPYSEKMWGVPWDNVPKKATKRIDKNTGEKSIYFPDQFCGLPKHGYTVMMDSMFDGAELILNNPINDWQYINADKIVYCGRLDLIKNNKTGMCLGQQYGKWLDFRNLEFTFISEGWEHKTSVVNYCRSDIKYTRKTCYKKLNGGNSDLVSYELPISCMKSDPVPFYPIEIDKYKENQSFLESIIKSLYPNMICAGRIGSYKYIDMDVCILQGMKIADSIKKEFS